LSIAGPNPKTQLDLLLAAANAFAPQFFHGERCRKVDQFRRRLDVFILAAAAAMSSAAKLKGSNRRIRV